MKQQLRSICMILGFLVGAIFHEELAFLTPILPVGIAIMLSITFLGVDTSRLKPRRKHISVLFSIYAIAMVSWYAVHLAGYPLLAEALFFCAATPIASASPIIVSLLKGDVEFSTTAMVLSQVVFSILMPLLLPLVVQGGGVSYGELALLSASQIAAVLVAPAAIAALLRWLYPPCSAWPAKLRDVSLGIWVFNLVVVAAAGVERLLQTNTSYLDMLPILFAAAALCAFCFFFGYRLGAPNLKRECSQALGQKNTILSLYMATQSYAAPLAYLGPLIYVFCHNIANAVQLSLAARDEKLRQVKDSEP